MSERDTRSGEAGDTTVVRAAIYLRLASARGIAVLFG